jgi:hypothetical protein
LKKGIKDMIKIMMPIPPTHSIIPLQSNTEYGICSKFSKESPLVAKPAILSKTASPKFSATPLNTKGRLQQIEIITQVNTMVINPSRLFIPSLLFSPAKYSVSPIDVVDRVEKTNAAIAFSPSKKAYIVGTNIRNANIKVTIPVKRSTVLR